MMGAGGFIRNPGWESFSSDDLMDEEYGDGVLINNFFLNDGDDVELNSEVLLFMPGEEMDENNEGLEDYILETTSALDDDEDEEEEEDDADFDYLPSDDGDFDDALTCSDDSAPELSN